MEQTVTLTSAARTGAGQQFATFFLAGMFFGVEVLKVQEVLRYQEMTPVAQSPDVIEGLINLRGQIVTAFDVRRRLKLPPREAGSHPMNVVIRSEEGAISLLVDQIGDVIEVGESAYEAPPANIPAAQRAFVDGVYKLADRLLLVLNTERVLTIEPQG